MRTLRPNEAVLLRGEEAMPIGLYHLHLATAAQLCQLHYSPGSLKAVKARLKTLVAEGFVQADTVPTKRVRAPYYYALGQQGVKHLAQEGYDTADSWRHSKETDKSGLFVEHTLELGDVLVSAALLRTMSEYRLHTFTHERVLKRSPFKLEGITLIPDAFLDVRNQGRRLPVLLEHDRGTEEQHYFRRRIRAYMALLKSRSYQQLSGGTAITIAFTTFVGPERVEQMRKWTGAEVERDPALTPVFRFAALSRPLHPIETWLGAHWCGVHDNEQPFLAA